MANLPSTRHEVRKLIDSSPLLRDVRAALVREFNGDAAHDMTHFERVAIWTLRLGEGKLAVDDAICAALLHDIVHVPKNSPDRARTSELCAKKAAEILRPLGVDGERLKIICEAIEDHSFSRGCTPRSLLGDCLQDADRLEALGALGIMRVVSTGAGFGSSYVHAEDPWARSRELNDRRYMIDHCFTKLFKLPGTMRTAAGKAEAQKRAEVIERFLDDLGGELGEPR